MHVQQTFVFPKYNLWVLHISTEYTMAGIYDLDICVSIYLIVTFFLMFYLQNDKYHLKWYKM